MMMVIFNIVNIFGHLVLFQIKQKGYNPGFITALIVLLPFVAIALVQAWEANLLSFEEALIALTGGILSAASLPILGVIQKRKYHHSP
jgi:predicted HAD superfamily phosphohydrolase